MSQLCCRACSDGVQVTSSGICMTQCICSLSVWSCVVLLGQSLWTLKQDNDSEFNVLDPQSYQLFWAQSETSWDRCNKETEEVVGCFGTLHRSTGSLVTADEVMVGQGRHLLKRPAPSNRGWRKVYLLKTGAYVTSLRRLRNALHSCRQ